MIRPSTKTLVILFLLAHALLTAGIVCANVQEVIDQVDLGSLTGFVSELTGEVPVVINGTPHTLESRHRDFPGNDLAADYIAERLESYGLTVYNQQYSPTGRNIHAVQPGAASPDLEYIICAHYDSMPDSSMSPGADDNASGTAAVLEAARILSNYQSAYTLIYALWDEEEQGLIGSDVYAELAAASGDRILGVINIDMIGWDSNDDRVFLINTRPIADSMLLSDRTLDIAAAHVPALSPVIVNPGYGSDNWAFWLQGYAAIVIEEDYFNDWNAYHHMTGDRLSEFNLPYFHDCSRLVIGTLASLFMNPVVDVAPHEVSEPRILLAQNYPNPFRPTTTIRFALAGSADVDLAVLDVSGRHVKQLKAAPLTVGRHDIQWDGRDDRGHAVASGVYFYRLKTRSFEETRRMILVR